MNSANSSELECSGFEFNGLKFSKFEFSKFEFSGFDLSGLAFSDVDLSRIEFSALDLSGLEFSGLVPRGPICVDSEWSPRVPSKHLGAWKSCSRVDERLIFIVFKICAK